VCRGYDLKARFKVELKLMSKEAVGIIGGRERRRRWSMEEKLRIVHGTQAPGECVRAVVARHDVYPSLLHYWRRQLREGRLGQPELPSFVPVRLAEPAPLPDMVPPVMKERDGVERIEIALPDGCRLLVGSDVSMPALRRVVIALRQ
jgi:transposase